MVRGETKTTTEVAATGHADEDGETEAKKNHVIPHGTTCSWKLRNGGRKPEVVDQTKTDALTAIWGRATARNWDASRRYWRRGTWSTSRRPTRPTCSTGTGGLPHPRQKCCITGKVARYKCPEQDYRTTTSPSKLRRRNGLSDGPCGRTRSRTGLWMRMIIIGKKAPTGARPPVEGTRGRADPPRRLNTRTVVEAAALRRGVDARCLKPIQLAGG